MFAKQPRIDRFGKAYCTATLPDDPHRCYPERWPLFPPLAPYTTLTAGQKLLPTKGITSPNGHYHLRYQLNGNVGLYKDGVHVWGSGAPPIDNPGFAVMNATGDFVTVDAAGKTTWSTQTFTPVAGPLVVTDDGDVVVLLRGKPLWFRKGGPMYLVCQPDLSACPGYSFG